MTLKKIKCYTELSKDFDLKAAKYQNVYTYSMIKSLTIL